MLKKLAAVSVLGLGAALFGGGTAQAQSATVDLAVNATVIDTCHITATSVNFGNYDVLAAGPTDAAGAVTVTCTNLLPWEVLLGQGVNADAGSTNAAPLRRMASGADMLSYGLFTDAARSITWQNVTLAGVSGAGTGSPQVTPVYGRIPALQAVPVGVYADTVVATINY